jgi:hypothetical protein
MEIHAWCGTHGPCSLFGALFARFVRCQQAAFPADRGFLLPWLPGSFAKMNEFNRCLQPKTQVGGISLRDWEYLSRFLGAFVAEIDYRGALCSKKPEGLAADLPARMGQGNQGLIGAV